MFIVFFSVNYNIGLTNSFLFYKLQLEHIVIRPISQQTRSLKIQSVLKPFYSKLNHSAVVESLRNRFFGSVDPFKIVFRVARATPSAFLLSHSHADTPFIDPTPVSPSLLCSSGLALILLLPFFPLALSRTLAFLSFSLSLSATVSLQRLVTPGETLENRFRSPPSSSFGANRHHPRL